jgi:hypothetical protein
MTSPSYPPETAAEGETRFECSLHSGMDGVIVGT